MIYIDSLVTILPFQRYSNLYKCKNNDKELSLHWYKHDTFIK